MTVVSFNFPKEMRFESLSQELNLGGVRHDHQNIPGSLVTIWRGKGNLKPYSPMIGLLDHALVHYPFHGHENGFCT